MLFKKAFLSKTVATLCLASAVSLTMFAPSVAMAKEPAIQQKTIQFKKGATSLKVNGKIKGYQVIDYKVTAAANQSMTVTLTSKNPSLYFNVIAPNATDEAIFIGSTSGNTYKDYLPESGTYTIRVYLMRNAARRGEVAPFSLNTRIVN